MRLLLLALLLAGCTSDESGGFGRADGAPEPPTEEPADTPDPGTLSDDLAFVDATAGAGFDLAPGTWPEQEVSHPEETAGGGAVLADLDGDGVTDLLLTSASGGNRLHLGLGDGRFQAHEGSGVESIEGVRAASAGDLDGDGLRELILLAGHRVLLLPNLGGGSFDEPRVLLEADGPYLYVGAALADADGDGEVDIYVSAYGEIHGPEDVQIEGEDRLLLGRGDLEFVDGSAWLGSGAELGGQTFVSAWLDCDEDGQLDLYSVKDFGALSLPNQLFLRQGESWTEQGADLGLDLTIFGMGIAAGDADLDGTLDIVLSDTHGRLHALSMQGGSALERSEAWGLGSPDLERSAHGWGMELADLDNSRHPELLTAWGYKEGREAQELGVPQRNSLHRWAGDGFEDASALLPVADGLAWRSPLVTDLNADGALDVLWVGVVDAPQLLLGVPNGNRWLEVKLEGPPGNRDGLGARVCVVASGLETCERVGAGSRGLFSSREPVAHFGLGVDALEEVSVHWPDGSVSEKRDVEPNQRITMAR